MKYETSGMLSYHAIGAEQAMHSGPGRTSERLSGTRAATTFRKLPTQGRAQRRVQRERSSSPASIGAFRAEVDPLPFRGLTASKRTRSRRPCTACPGCRRRGRSPRPSASRRGGDHASRSGSGPRRRSATRPPSRGRACGRPRRSGAGTGRARPSLPRRRPAGTRAHGGARGRRPSRSPATTASAASFAERKAS